MDAGLFPRASQWESSPELHSTFLLRIPFPHWMEQSDQAAVTHFAFSTAAFLLCPVTSHPSGSGGGTIIRWPFTHSGGCSQTILHLGLGQSLGFLQCHWHWGSAQEVWHPELALLQSSSHFGFSHLVVHFGVLQSRTLLPSHGSLGQNIAQLGSPHFTLHPLKWSAPSLGQRVSQAGTPHRGWQSCWQTGLSHSHLQWGTQLFRWSNGTKVGCSVALPCATFSATPSVCTASVVTAPRGSLFTLMPLTGL
mmetsp:Transcript_32092/g.78343  ORF Transcript_32092/g.78343 Transcript_32092/m.78343 type:complete len:250 (-) Transcript_32092:258-1007(-)